jgi:hypothetical protein
VKSDKDACEYFCDCSEGYEHCDKDKSALDPLHTCCEVDPCDDDDHIDSDKCTCVDKDPPENDFECDCESCYHSVEIGFGEECKYDDPCGSGGGDEACKLIREYHSPSSVDPVRKPKADVNAKCIDHEPSCDWECECSTGFEWCTDTKSGDPKKTTCCEIQDCEDTDCAGDTTTYPGVHGHCVDDLPKDVYHTCDCDSCYTQSFRKGPNDPECIKIDYCSTALCSAEGDGDASCIEQQCSYQCDCSTGYIEKDGICKDYDDCEDDPCHDESDDVEHTCVDLPAPSDSREGGEQNWGYTCYCACGFKFSEEKGECESCLTAYELSYNEGADKKVGTIKVSNDDNNLYITTEALSKYKISTLAININGGDDKAVGITTMKDTVFYPDGAGRPAVDKYGVTTDTDLIRKNLGKSSWTISIPKDDITGLKTSCGLIVSVFVDLECDRSSCTPVTGGTTFAKGEHLDSFSTPGANGKGRVLGSGNEWYGYLFFHPCGWDCPEVTEQVVQP